MNYTPSAPWNLECPWCEYRINVNARGGRGHDQGAGFEAAEIMSGHVERHGRTWREFLEATP